MHESLRILLRVVGSIGILLFMIALNIVAILFHRRIAYKIPFRDSLQGCIRRWWSFVLFALLVVLLIVTIHETMPAAYAPILIGLATGAASAALVFSPKGTFSDHK